MIKLFRTIFHCFVLICYWTFPLFANEVSGVQDCDVQQLAHKISLYDLEVQKIQANVQQLLTEEGYRPNKDGPIEDEFFISNMKLLRSLRIVLPNSEVPNEISKLKENSIKKARESLIARFRSDKKNHLVDIVRTQYDDVLKKLNLLINDPKKYSKNNLKYEFNLKKFNHLEHFLKFQYELLEYYMEKSHILLSMLNYATQKYFDAVVEKEKEARSFLTDVKYPYGHNEGKPLKKIEAKRTRCGLFFDYKNAIYIDFLQQYESNFNAVDDANKLEANSLIREEMKCRANIATLVSTPDNFFESSLDIDFADLKHSIKQYLFYQFRLKNLNYYLRKAGRISERIGGLDKSSLLEGYVYKPHTEALQFSIVEKLKAEFPELDKDLSNSKQNSAKGPDSEVLNASDIFSQEFAAIEARDNKQHDVDLSKNLDDILALIMRVSNEGKG